MSIKLHFFKEYQHDCRLPLLRSRRSSLTDQNRQPDSPRRGVALCNRAYILGFSLASLFGCPYIALGIWSPRRAFFGGSQCAAVADSPKNCRRVRDAIGCPGSFLQAHVPIHHQIHCCARFIPGAIDNESAAIRSVIAPAASSEGMCVKKRANWTDL